MAKAQLQGSLHTWSMLCSNIKYFVSHESSCELEPLGGNPGIPGEKWTALGCKRSSKRRKVMPSVVMCGIQKYSLT